MASTKVCQDIRLLLQARLTQQMLTDAIVGLVAKGVYLSAKHNVLATADKEIFLEQLGNLAGSDDITEAVQALRIKYEFVTKFGEIRHGQMSQLIRATSDVAASDRAGRSELLLLKDYSFTFRELSPLFEMLREARNYFAHNTLDREDIGWNGLIISAVTRILERGNFLDKKRVEERANLRTKTIQLFNQLISTQIDPKPEAPPIRTEESNDENTRELIRDISPHVVEIIENLSSNQAELISNAKSVESQLSSISRKIEALKITTEQSFSSRAMRVSQEHSTSTSSSARSPESNVTDRLEPPLIGTISSYTNQKNDLVEEPLLASESLISVDALYEKLLIMKNQIKEHYEHDSRWIGPSSNLLQRAIVTIIVTNEPDNLSELLKHEDVMWRIKKEKNLLTEQSEVFGNAINELLNQTAWAKDYQ